MSRRVARTLTLAVDRHVNQFLSERARRGVATEAGGRLAALDGRR